MLRSSSQRLKQQVPRGPVKHKEFDRDSQLKKELEAQKSISESLMAEIDEVSYRLLASVKLEWKG